MAILTGQNIGGNPRGILNLGATINTPLDTTLRNVTDGLGNNSPLQLSTTEARVLGDLSVHKNSGLLAYFGSSAGNSGISLYFNQISFVGGNAMYLSNTGSNIIFETNSVERGRFASSNFVLGTTTASARLHVRGDGINAVAIFQNSAGTAGIAISSDALTLSVRNYQIGNNSNLIQAFAGAPDPNGSAILYTSIATTAQLYAHNFVSGTRANLTGTSGQLNISGGFAAGAGSGNFRLAGIEYTINNSGAQTGTATGIFLNATETALNGMTHNLMDLQVGGVSRFRVFNTGGISANGVYVNGTNRAFITSPSDSIISLYNSGGDNFNRLQLGGTTNAFPAIKRNGAAIDFRLADDSGFADINAANATFRSPVLSVVATFNATASGTGGIEIQSTNTRRFRILSTSALTTFEATNTDGFTTNAALNVGGSAANNASAILQADSTTKGFLPPRMTTTQKNAITTPATGLVLYDSTLNKLCVYTGSAWETITSV